jgi:hypothetical protein
MFLEFKIHFYIADLLKSMKNVSHKLHLASSLEAFL